MSDDLSTLSEVARQKRARELRSEAARRRISLNPLDAAAVAALGALESAATELEQYGQRERQRAALLRQEAIRYGAHADAIRDLRQVLAQIRERLAAAEERVKDAESLLLSDEQIDRLREPGRAIANREQAERRLPQLRAVRDSAQAEVAKFEQRLTDLIAKACREWAKS